MYFTGKRVDDVAKEHGISKPVLYKTIKGDTRGDRPREVISKIVGKPITEIWPEKVKEGR